VAVDSCIIRHTSTIDRVRRISTRFALMLAAAAIVPLLAYGAISLWSVRSGAETAVVQGNLNVAARVAEEIELYVTNIIRILNGVATDLKQTNLQHWQQDRILKNYVLDFPEFRELTLLDSRGEPLATSRLGKPTTTVPGADSIRVGDAILSQFAVDDDLLPTAVVAFRLKGSDGWLVGRLNLEELWRMVNRIRVGSAGYALVVSNDGRLVAHGDPSAKTRVARGDNLANHPLVIRVRNTNLSPQGVASIEYDDAGRRMLGVAANVPALQWTVMVEQPVSEAFAIPISLQNQLAAAIAIALAAMLVAGYLWGRTFINPILRLTTGTQALAAGRLDERVIVDSTDELGQLGSAFNNMADKLVELQEDVRKKERQAMFGRIAIGLVHDLSHPIQNIGNSCKLIVRMWDDHEYRENFKRTVERELAQVKRVLDDLRNVARPLPLDKFPLDVNKALGELVESMQPTAQSAGLTIETQFVFGPLFIEGDLFALNRVYRNLIMNALQATAPGGNVTVRTLRQNDQAIIEIADTGVGIPAERIETIFDDFVTTKRRGLGLGLAISKKVVEQLEGTIAVTSQVGLGSTFTLRFPQTKARPSQLAAV
jgi:signal transduction histidine kinase